MQDIDEAQRAMQLLNALEAHIQAGHAPLHGYQAVAELIKWNTSVCLPVGQLCLRLDLAAFNAGLPMLALNWVRTSDGSINNESFPPQWTALEKTFVEQMVAQMQAHSWTPVHFALLRDRLAYLPSDISVLELWVRREGTVRKWLRREARVALSKNLDIVQ